MIGQFVTAIAMLLVCVVGTLVLRVLPRNRVTARIAEWVQL